MSFAGLKLNPFTRTYNKTEMNQKILRIKVTKNYID